MAQLRLPFDPVIYYRAIGEMVAIYRGRIIEIFCRVETPCKKKKLRRNDGERFIGSVMFAFVRN